MTTEQLIKKIKENSVQFSDVIAHIENLYSHTPAAFTNGTQRNEENQNQGSAKVFSFAKLNNLSEEDTLFLFAEHYQSVLETPEANDHQNIRQFVLNGWAGITFDTIALTLK